MTEERKVLDPGETARLLAGSGVKVVAYPGEVEAFPGVTFSFEIQRVVGFDVFAFDVMPGLDDREPEIEAAGRFVVHPDLRTKNDVGPWSCATEEEAETFAADLRKTRPRSIVSARPSSKEGSTEWVVDARDPDPESIRRYQNAIIAGGARAPRIFFGRREDTPAGVLHYRDVPRPVLEWLFVEIEQLSGRESRVRSGAGRPFPVAADPSLARPGLEEVRAQPDESGGGGAF